MGILTFKSFKSFKKSELYFFVILGIVHILYFIYAIIRGNIYVGDFLDYLQQSENIKEHLNWYSGIYKEPFNLDLYSKRPPLYALFIFLIKAVYNSDYFVLFMQSVLSFINFAGMIRLLRKYEFKFDYYTLLIVLIVFYPSQFIYSNFIMAEILFQTFLFWTFYNFVLFVKTGEIRYVVYYNLFLSLALLTKPVVYLLWIPGMLFMIYFFFKYKRNYSLIISGLIPLAAVLIVSYYNYTVTGYFHFSSLKHSNILQVNSNFILINKLGYEEAEKIFEKDNLHLDSIKIYSEQSKEKERMAMQVITENLGDYMKFHLKGMAVFFMDPGRFDLAEFFRVRKIANEDIYYAQNNSGIYYVYMKDGFSGVLDYFLRLPIFFLLVLLIVIIINVIMIISIINFIFTRNAEPEVRIFFILLIGYICVFSGNVGVLRYKLPLLQIILFSVPFFYEKIRSKRETMKSKFTVSITK